MHACMDENLYAEVIKTVRGGSSLDSRDWQPLEPSLEPLFSSFIRTTSHEIEGCVSGVYPPPFCLTLASSHSLAILFTNPAATGLYTFGRLVRETLGGVGR